MTTKNNQHGLSVKTGMKAGGLTANHNETLAAGADNPFDPAAALEIEETELDTIASALCVRSGLKAGTRPLVPCV